MPITNFSETSSAEIIPSQGAKVKIVILAIWFELSADATFVSWGFNNGSGMFPVTKSGLKAINLVQCSQVVRSNPNENLYLNISGSLTVRGSVIWKVYRDP